MNPLPVHHDVALLALSYLTSALGAWTALMLSRQVFFGHDADRGFWIGSAAFTMGGGGIWSMHFIAMLAYRLPVPVGYDPWLTLLSLVVAFVSTAAGFQIARIGETRRCLLAGIPMGLGIAAMHFIGIAAMRLPATMSLDWSWVALAVTIGIAASSASLCFTFRSSASGTRLAGALGLALGVSAMHHSAMVGVTFYSDPESTVLVPTGLSGPILGYGVFVVTLMVLAVALGVTRPLWVQDPYGLASELE